MPDNFFANRDKDSMSVDNLFIGDTVLIIEKQNQGTKDINDLVKGQITAKLSRPGAVYRNGAKVKIMLDPTDWRYKTMGPAIFVGRVQYVLNHINGMDIK